MAHRMVFILFIFVFLGHLEITQKPFFLDLYINGDAFKGKVFYLRFPPRSFSQLRLPDSGLDSSHESMSNILCSCFKNHHTIFLA